ncbi:MAG: type I restriction-modification system subunit M, partial [Culicoidibacterales bacterium]
LNIPRYVNTFEAEEIIDMEAIGKRMKQTKKEKDGLIAQLYNTIGSLEGNKETQRWLEGALEVFSNGE